MMENQRPRIVALIVLALVFTTGAAVSAITLQAPTATRLRTETGVSISRSLDQLDLSDEQEAATESRESSSSPSGQESSGSQSRPPSGSFADDLSLRQDLAAAAAAAAAAESSVSTPLAGDLNPIYREEEEDGLEEEEEEEDILESARFRLHKSHEVDI